MNLLHILTNVTGTYGVSGLEYQIGKGDNPVKGGMYSKVSQNQKNADFCRLIRRTAVKWVIVCSTKGTTADAQV